MVWHSDCFWHSGDKNQLYLYLWRNCFSQIVSSVLCFMVIFDGCALIMKKFCPKPKHLLCLWTSSGFTLHIKVAQITFFLIAIKHALECHRQSYFMSRDLRLFSLMCESMCELRGGAIASGNTNYVLHLFYLKSVHHSIVFKLFKWLSAFILNNFFVKSSYCSWSVPTSYLFVHLRHKKKLGHMF